MKQIFLIILLGLFFGSCDTEGFDNPPESAVFAVDAEINGQSINLQAGLEGVENIPGIIEQNGALTYFSYFNIPATSNNNTRKLTLQFKEYPKVINEALAKTEVLNNELDYVLSYTGVEGLKVTPHSGSITDIYTEMWAIDGQIITTQADALIPNPILQDKGFVDVRYNLNIPGKFVGSVNSQISNKIEESCHGKIDITTNSNSAEIRFTSDNVQMDQIEWGSGQTSTDIEIDLIPQTVFVEANSADCVMNAQMDIMDPLSIPSELGFDISEVVGPATDQPTKGFVLELINDQGEIFRSDFGLQNQSSKIEIESVTPHAFPHDNNSILIVDAKVNATLYNLDQTNSINLTEGSISFAFAHPMN